MNNPLDEIKNWLTSIEKASSDHLISIAAHFHTDENIYIHTGSDRGREFFFAYLNHNNISNREVVIRTLFTIILIDFALSGKNSEEGWTEFFDRMLAMRSIGNEKGMDISWIDQKLNSFQKEKEHWLVIADSWATLKFDFLNERNIMNWYTLAGTP